MGAGVVDRVKMVGNIEDCNGFALDGHKFRVALRYIADASDRLKSFICHSGLT
jgi:hypothetical protein